MKVKELIEELQKADPDTEVSFEMAEGCCGDWLDLNLSNVSIFDSFSPAIVAIRFESVPGYLSCIQSGGTKRSHEEYWKKHGKKV